MPKIIEVECPSCGVWLEIPRKWAAPFYTTCSYCGERVRISKDRMPFKKDEPTSFCPVCGGRGAIECMGISQKTVRGLVRTFELYAEACVGDGKCRVYCSPEKSRIISNYCRDGKCVWCNGTGKRLGRCRICNGTGECRFCLGSGTCRFCGGKGEVRCRRCRGKGTLF